MTLEWIDLGENTAGVSSWQVANVGRHDWVELNAKWEPQPDVGSVDTYRIQIALHQATERSDITNGVFNSFVKHSRHWTVTGETDEDARFQFLALYAKIQADPIRYLTEAAL